MNDEKKQKFPFENVYRHFADEILKDGLGKEGLEPFMAIVKTDWNAIEDIQFIPNILTNKFFSSSLGKDFLGDLIRKVIKEIGTNPFCLVIVSEAYFKEMKKPSEEAIKHLEKASLQYDVEAKECIMISIYGPGEQRMGILKIGSDRSLTDDGLLPLGDITGRMTNNPDSISEMMKKGH